MNQETREKNKAERMERYRLKLKQKQTKIDNDEKIKQEDLNKLTSNNLVYALWRLGVITARFNGPPGEIPYGYAIRGDLVKFWQDYGII